nr:DMT family protein [Flavobacterium sp.]
MGVFATVMTTWAVAFFICLFQVPANKIRFRGNEGPFSLLELKVIQEIITLFVFVICSTLLFKNETFR